MCIAHTDRFPGKHDIAGGLSSSPERHTAHICNVFCHNFLQHFWGPQPVCKTGFYRLDNPLPLPSHVGARGLASTTQSRARGQYAVPSYQSREPLRAMHTIDMGPMVQPLRVSPGNVGVGVGVGAAPVLLTWIPTRLYLAHILSILLIIWSHVLPHMAGCSGGGV